MMVDGDPEQLDRVFINLLSNAMKYTPRGGTIRLSAGRDSECALLTVTDTGMGIPEHDQRSVFTRFFRASNAVAQQVPGSGLGLSIVQTVISNHHGDVVLESKEGEGTTVVVRIPLLADGHMADDGGERSSESTPDRARAEAAQDDRGSRPDPAGGDRPAGAPPSRVRRPAR